MMVLYKSSASSRAMPLFTSCRDVDNEQLQIIKSQSLQHSRHMSPPHKNIGLKINELQRPVTERGT